MKSKEINDKIYSLERTLFMMKLEINSNYNSGYQTINMIKESFNLKKELSHLKKLQKLRKERKQKLKKLENAE